jgi:antitoxin component YwqK of YwqJK toxin-antitoxin module
MDKLKDILQITKKSKDSRFNDHNKLDIILDRYKEYTSDKKFIYKLCYDESKCKINKNRTEDEDDNINDDTNYISVAYWLVIMVKIPKTKTNELRGNIANKFYAKFRANVLKVVKVINIDQPKKTTSYIINDFKGKKTKYEVGKLVYADYYDDDINKICTGGIHYFKTLNAAYFYRDVPNDYNGIWIDRYDNGQKKSKGEYFNGAKINKWVYWYDSTCSKGTAGQKMAIETYSNDTDFGESIKFGEWIIWYPNGIKQSIGNYLYDRREGKWTEFYENGNKKDEGIYLYGKRKGKWFGWHDNKMKAFEGEYLCGNRIGTWFEWHENGQLELECNYSVGKENGKWTWLFDNKQKRMEGMFLNGQQTGMWTKWNINGEKISEKEYT